MLFVVVNSALILSIVEQKARMSAIQAKRNARKAAKAKAKIRMESSLKAAAELLQDAQKTVMPVKKKRKREEGTDSAEPSKLHVSVPRTREPAKVLPRRVSRKDGDRTTPQSRRKTR